MKTKKKALAPLESLAARHGTDKQASGHGYTRYYEQHFAPIRNRVASVLEIGVLKGASLRMWNQYFPYANIWGVDCDPEAKAHERKNVRVRIGNQIDEAFLRGISVEAGGFDIIIDDGGHMMSQQRHSFRILWPHLYPGGFYAIEDLHTSYWKEYRDSDFTTAEWLKGLVDDVNIRGKAEYANKHRNVAKISKLAPLEREVESIHFHPSLVVIQKMP